MNKVRRGKEREALLERVAEAYVKYDNSWMPTADVAMDLGLEPHRASQLVREARMRGLISRYRGRLGQSATEG